MGKMLKIINLGLNKMMIKTLIFTILTSYRIENP